MKLEQTWPLNSRLVDTDGAAVRATTANVAAPGIVVGRQLDILQRATSKVHSLMTDIVERLSVKDEHDPQIQDYMREFETPRLIEAASSD